MVGFKDFLYGLGTAGDTFTKIMLRAQERAQGHERQKELLGIRKGPALRSGMSAGDERAMERSYRDENEILADDFASRVGSKTAVPIRSGTLPADEAARGRKMTALPADYRPTPRQGAAFDTSQPGVRPDDASIMIGPGNRLVRGSFGEAMNGASRSQREAMFPSAMLDAELAQSPFAQAMKDAGDKAAEEKAKRALSGVSASRQSGVETMDRLAPLDPAAVVAASDMGLVGKSLKQGRATLRAEGVADARTKAQQAADIGVAADATKSDARSQKILDRTTTIAQRKGITAIVEKMTERGETPTPEAIVAASKGVYSLDQAKDTLANPMPTVQAAGQNETAAARKGSIADARRAQSKARDRIAKAMYASPEDRAALEASYDILIANGAMKESEREAERRKDGIGGARAQQPAAAPAKTTKPAAKPKVTKADVARELGAAGLARGQSAQEIVAAKSAAARALGITDDELEALLP